MHLCCVRELLVSVFIIVCFFCFSSEIVAKVVYGRIIDVSSGEPVSLVQVFNKNLKQGSVSNKDGMFFVSYDSFTDTIVFQYVGYKTMVSRVDSLIALSSPLTIALEPEIYQLGNIVVRAKKNREKYKRKGNPAVDLIKKVIDNKDINRFRTFDSYRATLYDKISVSLTPIDFDMSKKFILRKLPFLDKYIDTVSISDDFVLNNSRSIQYADTSDSAGYAQMGALRLGKQPVLIFFISEESGRVMFDKKSGSMYTIIEASRKDGIDKFIDYGNLDSYVQMLFRPIDIFSNQIRFINSELVSPLSSTLATTFYNYYIMDTIVVDGLSCIDLAFVPSNTESFGFMGHLYIVNDSSYALRSFRMHLPHNSNMNWVKNLWVGGDFCRLPGGMWQLKQMETGVHFSFINNAKHSLLGRQTLFYDNYSFDTLSLARDYKINERVYTCLDAKRKGSASFDSIRPFTLSEKEKNVDSLYAEIMSVKPMRHLMQTITTLVKNYIPTRRPGDSSRFDIGPILNTISYHNQEGIRLRVGGMTTANLNKRWFTNFYIAYGFRDRRVKGGIDIIHSFTDKLYHPYEPLRNNLTLTLKYDVFNLSESHLNSDRDFILSAISYKSRATPMQYIALMRLKYDKQWGNGVRLITYVDAMNNQPNGANGGRSYLQVPYFDRSPLTLKYIRRDADNSVFERYYYHEYAWTSVLRFSFGNFAYSDNRGAESASSLWRQHPIITISNELSFISEDRFLTNRLSLEIEKRFMLSFFGYVDAIAHLGYVFGRKVPFTKLFSSATSHSYFINKRAFSLMSEMEFVFDRYVEWHITYHLNGLIVNRIPFLSKTKLRGVVSFHGVLGYLGEKNNPNLTYGLYDLPYVYYPRGSNEPVQSKTNFRTADRHLMPYMEISAGIENIFKILRIDYVRRLTHNDGLGGWQKNSIRFSFNVNL